MSLVFGYDPNTLPESVRLALDDITVALQTWAGKQEGAGKWINVPYESGNFRAGAGTWTVDAGDQKDFAYSVMQDLMFLKVRLLKTSTNASVGNQLYVKIPGGYRIAEGAEGYQGVMGWNSSAANGLGQIHGQATPFDHELLLLRDVASPSTAWPTSETNTLFLYFNIVLRVRRDQAL